jgi:anti-sigma regulatory factor (Ser/Thr protein kinase)
MILDEFFKSNSTDNLTERVTFDANGKPIYPNLQNLPGVNTSAAAPAPATDDDDDATEPPMGSTPVAPAGGSAQLQNPAARAEYQRVRSTADKFSFSNPEFRKEYDLIARSRDTASNTIMSDNRSYSPEPALAARQHQELVKMLYQIDADFVQGANMLLKNYGALKEQDMDNNNLYGGGPDDEVKFFIDSEPAYYAVMDRFGDHIDFRGDDLVAPQRLWGAIQQTAGDAGGAADIAGLEDDRMRTDDELDEQGVAEGSDRIAANKQDRLQALENKLKAKGYARTKDSDGGEYQYRWTRDGAPSYVVNYRSGANGYAEFWKEQGVDEGLGDLRPTLGSKRDQGKSVRKWRRARGMDESGVAEGPTDDPRFQKMMGNIQKSTPALVSGYVALNFASEQRSKKIKGVSQNGKPMPDVIDNPEEFLSGKIEFTPDQVEKQLTAIGKKYGWDSIDSGQGQGYTEMFFDTSKEYTSNNQNLLAANIANTVSAINKFFNGMNSSLQATGLPGYKTDVWQGMGPLNDTNQIGDLSQIANIAKGKSAKSDPGTAIGKMILKYIPSYEAENDELGYDPEDFASAMAIAKVYIAQGEEAGLRAQLRAEGQVSDMIDELISDAGGSGLRTMSSDDLAEGHGNYAGDRPVNLGGVSMKKIQIGDTVRYIDQKAQVVDMSRDREHARITIPSSATTKTVLTSDLRQLGRGVSEEGSTYKDSKPWKRAVGDWDRLMTDIEKEDPEFEKQRQQDVKQTLKTKSMAGPRGHLPEADGSKDHDQQLSVQQLATISDEALDNAYHYGRSSPGNTFGWQANLKSAAYAKHMIDRGVTDIDQISNAIHRGWNTTAQAFVQNPEQFDDTEKLRAAGKLEAKLQQRAKLMNIDYDQLPDDEQEKDRVVARALLQALTGQQDVAEAGYDSGDYSNDRHSDDYGRDLVPTGSGGSRFVNHGAHDHTRGRPAKTHGFSKNLPADPFGRTAGKIPPSARPKQELDPFRELDELSPATLASYKTKAGAAATAADSTGDRKTGDRRFSGIVKATKKQFDQDAKQSSQAVHESRLRLMARIIKGQ